MTKPAPYPADTKAKGWRFELDLEQIQQSDTWALAAEVPMAQHALLMMWTTAWQQVPCGAMPADRALIRAKLKIPPKLWAPMADVVLRGWWPADDGRLYHDTIVSRVQSMLEAKEEARQRKADYRARKDGERQARPSQGVPPMSHGTDSGQQQDGRGKDNTGTGTGTGTGTISPSLRSGEGAARGKRKPANTPMPDGFGISERVAAWAIEKGHDNLPLHLEAFKAKVAAKGYQYVDWDSAFMEAIREDWAKLRGAQVNRSPPFHAVNRQEAQEARNRSVADEWMREQGAGDARAGQVEILEADH